MPFTPAHAAAVLPLSRSRLPLPALVAGSVSPDIPYYLPLPVSASFAHGPAGIGADVFLGGVALAVYVYAVRAPLRVLLGRAPEPAPRPAPGRAGWTVLALAVGAVTHMAWDSFTQTGGALVRAWPLLAAPVVGPHLLYNVLMYASSVLGLTALAWWAYTRRPWFGRERVRVAAMAVIGVCALLGAVTGGWSERAAVSGYDLVRCALVGAVTGAGAGLSGWVLWWWAGRWTARPRNRLVRRP